METVSSHRPRLVLELAQAFDASAEHVFAQLTEPAKLAQWWGPHGFTTPEIQLDLRVGGSYRLTMKPPDGEPFHLSGAFLEVDPPSRLRFSFRWDEPVPDDVETLVALSLESGSGATTVRLTHGQFATEERLELHRSGWADSFERLDSVIKAQAS